MCIICIQLTLWTYYNANAWLLYVKRLHIKFNQKPIKIMSFIACNTYLYTMHSRSSSNKKNKYGNLLQPHLVPPRIRQFNFIKIDSPYNTSKK